jgi:hypothetical protein
VFEGSLFIKDILENLLNKIFEDLDKEKWPLE